MENILTDSHCLSPYICKCCIVFKQFDGLNFDGLAGKHQKRQNFPLSKFGAIQYVNTQLWAVKLLISCWKLILCTQHARIHRV